MTLTRATGELWIVDPDEIRLVVSCRGFTLIETGAESGLVFESVEDILAMV